MLVLLSTSPAGSAPRACRNCGRPIEYSIAKLAYVHAKPQKPLPSRSKRASLKFKPTVKQYILDKRGNLVRNPEAGPREVPTKNGKKA